MFGLTPFDRRNAIDSYDPFKEMENFNKNFFGTSVSGFKTDIVDNGDKYELEADLPGFKKEDIKVHVDNGYLTISATRDEHRDEKNDKGEYVRRERSYGTFTRSFDISEIDEEKIAASFENGVLKLTLPKLTDKKPEVKQIEIK